MDRDDVIELAAIGSMIYGIGYLALVTVCGLVLHREAASFMALASMGMGYAVCVAHVHEFPGVAFALLALSVILGAAAGGLLIG